MVLSDPTTSHELELTFVVDTGCPDAFAIPTTYDGTFIRKIGQEKRGGTTGGAILADVYIVDVEKIGSLVVNHTTTCILSLTQNWDFGLMGVDFLNYLITKVYDNPNSKLMDIEPAYL